MSSKFNDLKTKLREIFQIDKQDLDFGIYRILNARAKQIDDFLNNSLASKVRNALAGNAFAEKSELESRLNEALAGARAAGISECDSPKVKEIREKLAALANASADSESVVYSHLLTFFSRYYDNGDFISKRRYKGDVYAVPYAGEEVKLHWANADQYYTKSGENFTNYDFKLPGGSRVRFKLVKADTAKDNIKDNDAVRCFVLWNPENVPAAPETSDDADESETDNAAPVPADEFPADFLEEKDGELFIYFQYLKFPKGTKQKDFLNEASEKIAAKLDEKQLRQKFGQQLEITKGADKKRLEKELTRYMAKNSSDYFIHKDLKTFLTRELDFYIKNEMLHLDDIQHAEAFRQIESGLRQIQTVRIVALELIDFMAQLENFQKKLWLKKKFVVRADYCITLDRVPAELHDEIFANGAQLAEWEKLGFPELGNGVLAENAEARGESELFPENESAEIGAKFDSRMVDTKFFPQEFKEKLLAGISDLDDACDGLLIRSENFQALNFLRERYHEKIKCIYIDPPYNTDSSPILYKNGYRHSTWCSLLEGRLSTSKNLLSNDGIVAQAIDEVEFRNLIHIGNIVFGEENYISSISIICNPQGRTDDFSNPISDYHIIHAKNISAIDTLRVKKLKKKKSEKQKGVPLKRTGTNSRREERPLRFFPMLIKDDVVSTITTSEYSKIYNSKEKKFDDEFVQSLCEKYKNEGYSVVLPRKEDGTLLVWQREFPRVSLECSSYFVRGETIYTPDFEDEIPKTCWTDAVYANPEYGTELLKGMFSGETLRIISKATPKSIYTVAQFLRMNCANTILDYFAGSGTTGHAVINLNREDGGKRKYILVEMGEHFETVLKPRIEKVVYSPNWKDGKPLDSDKGVSHCFKYLTLESYEDTLNNLQLSEAGAVPALLRDEYLLNYMLDTESRGSLLSTDDFRKPFDYALDIAADSSGATVKTPIDLVETFNYLIGLQVKNIDSQRERGFVKIVGVLPNGEEALIFWRDCEKIDNAELNKKLKTIGANTNDSEYAVYYVNGDHAVENISVGTDGNEKRKKVLQIEDEFLKKMFEE